MPSIVPLALALLASVSVAMPRARSQTPALEGYPGVGTPAIVKLISAGAEPRTRLRYRVAAGQKNALTMSTAMAMTMTLGDFAAPSSDLPIMKMTADLAVTDVAANGDITYDLAFTGMTAEPLPGMNPSLVAMVQKSASVITALKGTVTISDRGVNRAARFDLDKIADPNLRQVLGSISSSIESMSMPLPEEAVGTGARWEVRQAFQSAGTHTFQRAEYTVVSIDSESVALRVTLEQTAPPQTVSNPALPAGAIMEVERITGTGTGTMTLRLGNLVPTSEMASTSTAVMGVTMAGQRQRMTVDTRLKLTIGLVK